MSATLAQPGHLCVILHAHLPFVRHPEHPRFLEESWLFEAISESYLPLTAMLQGWARDQIPASLAFSVSPTLGAMLDDPLLRERTGQWMQSRLELAEKESFRQWLDPARREVAEYHIQHYQQQLGLWTELEGDLIGAWCQLRDQGVMELLTTSLTHCVLPLHRHHRWVPEVQVHGALEWFRDRTGQCASGFWLPECGYHPEVGSLLADAGIEWTLVDAHAFLTAQPPPPAGIWRPARTADGLSLVARDPASSRQVWSREEGYPGDAWYRDFHADIGWELPADEIGPYWPCALARGFTGHKPYRVTHPGGRPGDKAVYEPGKAVERAREHAAHFLASRARDFERVASHLKAPPMAVAPFDAELFGHWWHEGPRFLDELARQSIATTGGVQLKAVRDSLQAHPAQDTVAATESSWGEGGYFRMWLDDANADMHPRTLQLEGLISERLSNGAQGSRVLEQALREVLQAQASDWPFLIRMGTAPHYARARFEEHVAAAHRLLQASSTNSPAEQKHFLQECEARLPFPTGEHMRALLNDIRRSLK